MQPAPASDLAAALAHRLREAAAALIAVVDPLDLERWRWIPHPGVWSIGKDAEHVAEAAVYHQWIVRRSIGQTVPPRRPAIERNQLTTRLSPQEAVALVRRRTDDGARLLIDLTDEHLNSPTRPARARQQVLEVTIERVLIGHYEAHRVDIEAKLQAFV